MNWKHNKHLETFSRCSSEHLTLNRTSIHILFFYINDDAEINSLLSPLLAIAVLNVGREREQIDMEGAGN